MIKRAYYILRKVVASPGEKGGVSSGFWPDKIRKKVFKMCRLEEGRLLEVGCGEGLFLERIKDVSNLKVFGIDHWDEILKRANRRLERIGNVKLLQAKGDILPFKDSSFDTVVCVNVILNLPSENYCLKLLKEISRVCKWGGKIIFEIRNSLNPIIYFAYKLAKFYDSTNPPLTSYRIVEMLEILKQARLEVIEKVPIGFPLNSLAPIIIFKVAKE